MTNLQAQDVLAGLELNPNWKDQPFSWKVALKPFIEDIPYLFKEYLLKKVDIESLLKVKSLFYLRLLDGEFPETIFPNNPPDSAVKIRQSLMECVKTIEELQYCLETGCEDDVEKLFLEDCVQLEGIAKKLHKSNKLTFAYLFKIQPWIIIPFWKEEELDYKPVEKIPRLTGRQIISRLKKYPDWQSQPQEWKQAMEPFIKDIPKIFKGCLNERLDIQTFFMVKMIINRRLIEKDIPEKIFPEDTAKVIRENLTDKLITLACSLQPCFEEKNFLFPYVELQEEALDLDLAGKLTLADLFRLQPWILIPIWK